LTWTLNNVTFTTDMIEDNQGFVYCITDLANNKKYIGKKNFYSKRTLKALKGQKRKRKQIKESDWQDYYGSSAKVNALLLEQGPEIFKREILHLCKTKGEMSYIEAREQFEREVLLSDDYYNGIISCRVNQNHIKNLK